MAADAPIGPPPSGPLVSNLLKMDKRLQDCAQFDSAHVTPGEPASDHVRLVQQALATVAGASIPASETAYGPKTAEAVLAFKRGRTPPLCTRGTTSFDTITGIGTIRALDAELHRRDPKPEPKGNSAPRGQKPELALSGGCVGIGTVMDNPAAGDLRWGDGLRVAVRSAQTAPLIAPLLGMADFMLKDMMRSTTNLALAAGLATQPAAGPAIREARKCLEHFFSGCGVERVYRAGHVMSRAAVGDPGFQPFNQAIVREVQTEVIRAWGAGRIDDREIAAKLRPGIEAPGFRVGGFTGLLIAVIGGYQGYKLELCGLTCDTVGRSFAFFLDLEILDHDGVDDSDVAKPGSAAIVGASLAPFFVLQHDRAAGLLNRQRMKYRPHRNRIGMRCGPSTHKMGRGGAQP